MPSILSSSLHVESPEAHVGAGAHAGAEASSSADDFASLAAKQSDSQLTTYLPRELHFMEVLEHLPHESRSDLGNTSRYWKKAVKVQRDMEESADLKEKQRGSPFTMELTERAHVDFLGHMSSKDRLSFSRTGRYWFHLGFAEANKTMDEYERAGRLDPAHKDFDRVFYELPIGEINRKDPGRIDDLIKKIPKMPQDDPSTTPEEQFRSPAEAIICTVARWPEYTPSQRATLLGYAIHPTMIQHPQSQARALAAIGENGLSLLTPKQQLDWSKAVMGLPDQAMVIEYCDAAALTVDAYENLRECAEKMPSSTLRDEAIDHLETGRAQQRLTEMVLG